MGDDVKSFIFFATESLSILHPETKNYKFFKRSKKKKFFFRHTSSADSQCSKKIKNPEIKKLTITSAAEINVFLEFFRHYLCPFRSGQHHRSNLIVFSKKHICIFFLNFDTLCDARVCNWEKFQFRSILRHFLQSLSSRCQSSLDESWIWFRWQFPNRFLKNRCSGQSHGKIYLKIEWNFRAHKYYLSIKISMKFK